MDDIQQDVYLGDGVYCSFDGYQIWLAVNERGNKVVALEAQVLTKLIEYAFQVTNLMKMKEKSK